MSKEIRIPFEGCADLFVRRLGGGNIRVGDSNIQNSFAKFCKIMLLQQGYFHIIIKMSQSRKYFLNKSQQESLTDVHGKLDCGKGSNTVLLKNVKTVVFYKNFTFFFFRGFETF